jgi:predicted nucleotidyltransferase
MARIGGGPGVLWHALRNQLTRESRRSIIAIVLNQSGIATRTEQIAQFCRKWSVRELALFGSALRDDFRPDSDLDVLVAFAPHADWGLLDHVDMQFELQRLFGRKVDLISRRALERSSNWLLRDEILKTARVLFSSAEATHASR